MRFKVLILPGGGVFCTITSQLLAEYGRERCVQEMAQVVGGNSGGGILSLLYGRGMEFGTVRDLMRDALPSIFAKSWYNPWGIFGPIHDAAIIEKFLQKHLALPFGDLTPKIIVPAIDFQHRKVKVFDNITKQDDIKLPSWHVARATSAAPTYFKPFDCQKTAYIDGGLFENVPLLTTIMAIKSKMGVLPDKLDVFVIGTGVGAPSDIIPPQVASWGLRSWASPMIDSLTTSNEMASIFWAKQLGLRQLTVFNPIVLERGWKMNDPSLVNKLIDLASSHQAEFNRVFGEWEART